MKKCWAQAIKYFTSKPADQIEAIYFKTGKGMNTFGFFCCEPKCSQSKHRQYGIYMTTCCHNLAQRSFTKEGDNSFST